MKKTFLLIALFLCFSAIIYSQPGELDSSFGTNGIMKTDFETAIIAIQNDGKIVVAGGTSNGGNTYLVIARYNVDGSLDNTFSNDGKLIADSGSTERYATSIGIQSDGKILFSGFFYEPDNQNYISFIVRYSSDGTLDNTFSSDGKQTTDFRITTLAIQKDGKIIVAGDGIARYNTDGSPDRTFRVDSPISEIASVAIQDDGKILAGGTTESEDGGYIHEDFIIVRYNMDGSLDKSFSGDGIQTTNFDVTGEYGPLPGDDQGHKVLIQGDGKIVFAGTSTNRQQVGSSDYRDYAIARYNPDGTFDSTFSNDGKQTTHLSSHNLSTHAAAIQDDGKILVAGGGDEYYNQSLNLARYNIDGSLDSTFSEDGVQSTAIPDRGDIWDIAVIDNKLYGVGYGPDNGNTGLIARYLLNNKSEDETPTVSLTIPYNIVKYTAPARIKLNATATDEDGKIIKVQFFNGTTRLHTETEFPYGFLWINVPAGNYTLTAKAFDDSGNVVTSNAINVSVVEENVPPVVSLVSPVDDTTYTGPATIRLIANAKDPNDKISKVEFYNGNTLLRTEHYYPYTYWWNNVQPGTYTITAVATDDKGLSTTSAPVTITVTNASIVSRPSSVNSKTDLNSSLSLTLSPNPARSTLQVYTKGLQLNKPSTISVISASGVVMKTIQSNASNKVAQLDVSSMVSGVYTIKVVSGDKVMYKQFVKL